MPRTHTLRDTFIELRRQCRLARGDACELGRGDA